MIDIPKRYLLQFIDMLEYEIDDVESAIKKIYAYREEDERKEELKDARKYIETLCGLIGIAHKDLNDNKEKELNLIDDVNKAIAQHQKYERIYNSKSY